MDKLEVQAFFDHDTHSVTYLIWEGRSKQGAVIDPVLSFNLKSHKASIQAVKPIIKMIHEKGIQLNWILETHVHADHLSAAAVLKQHCAGTIAISEQICLTQQLFQPLYPKTNFYGDGRQFDFLLNEHSVLKLGDLVIRVIPCSGHTPACVSFYVEDMLFVGDTLLMPDFGCARADFLGGNAAELYDSIQNLLKLPDHTTVFCAHDYKSPIRKHFAWQSTIAEQKQNIHLQCKSRSDFIDFRQKRDLTLSPPRLMSVAVSHNLMNAGKA
jgi:glyoxylase-like metal-dependent hydrolase (beta-lactamase superfamily II)